MTFLVTFLRLVIALFLVRIAVRFVAGVIHGLREPRPAAGAIGVDMVRDRVCNTFVPRDRALMEVVGGHELFFCSQACRDRAHVLTAGS